MRIATESRTVFLAKIMPYLCFLAIALVFIFNIATGRAQTAVKGLLAFGIPVILASGIVIWRTRSLDESPTTAALHPIFTPRPFWPLTLVFLFLYLVSLCLLFIAETRPFAYFCLVAVMAGLIFVEILGIKRGHNWRRAIILTQIVLLFLNIVFSVTLKFPLYYGGTDIPHHMAWINTIIQNGYVTSEMSYYQHFPLFHIFNTAGMLITGMQLKTSYFALNGLAFAIAIPTVYILVSNLTKDTRIPLAATLCYATSQSIILYGAYMVTRCMAFVLSMLTLYLLTRQKSDLGFRILAILLIPSLILTHQTSLAQFSILLAILIIIELVVQYRPQYTSYNYFALFTCAYLAYWIYLCRPFFEIL